MTTTEHVTENLGEQLTVQLHRRRVLQLGQEVDDAVANRLCAQLVLLAAEDRRQEILLMINSPGGSVSAGLAIYDTMRAIGPDVATLSMGLAASMGQFLLSGGTPGKRYALPHSRILMHQGSAGVQGTAIDVQIQAANLEHTRSLMNRLNAQFTGQPVDTIAADSDRDHWFTAEEARDYGFVDRVITSLDEIRPTGRTTGLGY
ncbi:ATP-dependent Clp protease, protease subunit [Nakamurella panacisegetis]|uniref:ATP-dependent Clp protease proteolytic subunit n=1 Tax=Nakamurella panacisegetis TaxID=1090615 RepID=A0A1H0QQU9_9ACTN|nr:ATP-dependent Clp protease proteolytic subunit [Nakamurella panacisegetis]SDP19560.1 ATP-dependent Clp protease, protease subunit [Nakamurella panacisegetis]